jgi:predicted nucleic acid-binding protein
VSPISNRQNTRTEENIRLKIRAFWRTMGCRLEACDTADWKSALLLQQALVSAPGRVPGVEDADLRDLQIAVIARSRGWTVATRNTAHLPFVETFNPFNA